MSHKLLRKRFSPWIPLAVSLVLFATLGLLNEELIPKLVGLILLSASMIFLLIALILLVTRFVIKCRFNGFSLGLFFNFDTLSFYVLAAVISIEKGRFIDNDLWIIFFVFISLISLIRMIPGGREVLLEITRFVFSQAGIERPDTLNEKRNIESVQSFLPRQNHGIFCGEIRRRNNRES